MSEDDVAIAKSSAGKLRQMVRDVRGIVKKHEIDFGYISGWILSSLIKAVNRASQRVKTDKTPQAYDHWLGVVRPVLELAFYVCALDVRVRTTYSLCQIVKAVYDAKEVLPPGHFDQIKHLIAEELGGLIKSIPVAKAGSREDSVELYNLVICGTHFLKCEFTENNHVRSCIGTLLKSGFTYFKYITLKFVFLTDPFFNTQRDALNGYAFDFLSNGTSHTQCSERFLVLCDLLSAPDVANKEKRALFDGLFGGAISIKTMDVLSSKIGFVDWQAVNVEHLLRRKELRPVYAMA